MVKRKCRTMICIRFVCLLSLFTTDIWASSHWMVTEAGLIQPKDESPFLMAKPFDLLSFLNQETRWQNIHKIYNDLIMRQKRINYIWTQLQTETEISKYTAENNNCRGVSNLYALDWYTVFIEDGRFTGIQEEEFLLDTVEDNGDSEVPDCKKISSLTFSMAVFEHLEAMSSREHLNATPEAALPEIYSSIMSVDQFGHWLSGTLHKNNTSWLHYNLAAIYWRVKGNVPKALECSRRAVHHCPRYHKNVPLLCMGTILHRSRRTEDAIIILKAAVDHDPNYPVSHFVLGQAYAVVGDYNNSIAHFNKAIKIRKSFELAKRFHSGILCHIDMLTTMQYAQRTLKILSDELAKYQDLASLWIRIQTAFLKAMKHEEEEYDFASLEKNCHKMSEITGLKIRDVTSDSERNSIIHYFMENPQFQNWQDEKGVSALHTAYNLERMMKAIDSETGGPTMNLIADDIKAPLNDTDILKEIGPLPSFPDVFYESKKFVKTAAINKQYQKTKIQTTPTLLVTDSLKTKTGKILYPPDMKFNRNKELFDTDTEWPSNEFCKKAAPKFPDNVEAVYPVYLPFEHKGFSLKSLLTDKIGVPALKEHELPWHPPVCPTDKDLVIYTSKKGIKVQLLSEALVVDVLRPTLIRYLSTTNYEIVKKIQDAEIGHRIYVASQMKVTSTWILQTLASLYWRVRHNAVNALNCLLCASRTVDGPNRDVVLVSIASVLLEMGLVDDSYTYLEEAYLMNSYEIFNPQPPTNFLLAQMSLIKKNHKAQMFHLKRVVRVEPQYMDGFVNNLMNAWACILKQVNTLKELGDIDSDKDLCAEIERGVSMVCKRDGTNCRISHTHCTTGTSKETSTLVEMLEQKDEELQTDAVDDIDAKYFNKFLSAVPVDRHDKTGHKQSYDLMMKTVSRLVKGCGAHGCNEVDLRDFDMKEEECSYQHLHLEYWLHVVGFKQDLAEAEPGLPAAITSISPSHKKVPECRIPLDAGDDFFISRILAVDTANWDPVLSLMHQFAGTFEFYDYNALGAKIAKYVDAHPSSWAGALAAGWWCGASGNAQCAVRCVAAAHYLAPDNVRARTLRTLVALLHMQTKAKDAKDIAYLGFYSSPKNKIEAFLVGVSHTYNHEYDEAIWMYRYSVTFDENFLPAKACLHITMCLMIFGENTKKKQTDPPTIR